MDSGKEWRAAAESRADDGAERAQLEAEIAAALPAASVDALRFLHGFLMAEKRRRMNT